MALGAAAAGAVQAEEPGGDAMGQPGGASRALLPRGASVEKKGGLRAGKRPPGVQRDPEPCSPLSPPEPPRLRTPGPGGAPRLR